MNPPKNIPRPLLGALFALLAAPVISPAQVASTPSSAASASTGSDIVRLNPFEVREQTDDSFTTSSIGTGGRLVLDLKDVPAQYSVINRAFIDALGIIDITEAASWAPGQSFDSSNNLGNFDGQNTRFQQRGLTQINSANTASISGSSTGVQRNFYQNIASGNQDSYAVETFDFGQGPNGILFGGAQSTGQFQATANAAGLAGVQSSQTKKARLDATRTTLTAEVGAFDYRRFTLDHNRPLTSRIGIRINAVDLDTHGFINHNETQKRGLNITTTFRLSNTADLTVEMSYDKTNSHTPTQANENFSGWDGVTVARGLIDTTMMPNTVNNNNASLSKSYGSILGASTPVSWGGEPNGVTRYMGNGANNYFWEPESGVIVNMRGMLIARRADATSRTPLWTKTAPNGAFFVRGTRPNTVSNGVNIQTDVGFGVSNRSWLNQEGLPLDMFDRVLRTSRAKLLGPRENMSWEGPGNETRSRDLQFAFSQRLGNNWAIGLGGDWNRAQMDGRTMDRTMGTVNLDLNQLLPDGTPNPHYLEMFSVSNSDGIASQFSITVDQTLRTNVQNTTRAGRWGNYVFNLNGNINTRTTDYYYMMLGITDAPNDPVLSTALKDPRNWPVNGKVNMIMYSSTNGSYGEPRTPKQFDLIDSLWTGTGTEGDANAFTPTVTRTKATTQWVNHPRSTLLAPSTYQTFHTANLALQTTAKWWDDKLVFLGGYRRDYNSTILRQGAALAFLPSIDPISRPAGFTVPAGRWDGQTRYYKPVFQGTVQEYTSLTYRVRDANGNQVGSPRIATTRPMTTLPGGADGGNLNGNYQVMDPRYANDRFKDDYSRPTMGQYGSTKTYGLTFNVLPWFAPYINKSDQILPTPFASGTDTNTNVDLFGNQQTDLLAKGTDFGFKFSFLNGKLSGRYNYYNTTRYNNPSGNNIISNINTLINANRWDDVDINQGATTAINQLGINPLNANGDFSTRGNMGYEFELSAQVKGVRLTFNGGASSQYTDASTFFPLTKKYMADATKIAEFKALLEDAGASLDPSQKPVSNGRAVAAAPGLAVLTPLPGRLNGLDSTSAVNAYNNIWIQYDQLGTNATRTRNTPTANFFADYVIPSTFLKGLQVGAGIQWQGVRSLGNKANNTVLATDPTFGVVAVDDPTVNNTDLFWKNGIMKSQVNLRYTFRLKDNRTFGLALRVNNIGVPTLQFGSVSRQPQGDLTKPNRVLMGAGNPTSVNEPINARLTATYSFGGGPGGR
jgi:hypothetical protein